MNRKQKDLPNVEGEGVSKPEIPEIDKAAEAYVKIRDQRLALTPKQTEAKQNLNILMQKHKLTIYEFDDYIVELTPGESKIKVRQSTEPEE